MLTDVIKLLHDGSAVLVHRIGDLAKMWDYGIVAMTEIAAREYCGSVHRHRFHHNHRRSAYGTFFVISTMSFTG